jgi:pyruvate-formate lyase-activating enzyme
MPSRDRITAVLGFQQYTVVDFKRIHKRQVELTLEPKGCGWACPRCGQCFLIYYDRVWARLRDLDMAAHRSYLIESVSGSRVCRGQVLNCAVVLDASASWRVCS